MRLRATDLSVVKEGEVDFSVVGHRQFSGPQAEFGFGDTGGPQVVFVAGLAHKKEDETLTLIDAFCTEKLLPRLNDSKHTTSNGLLEQADSIPELVSSLARAHETFLVNLNEATRQLRDSGDTLNSRLAAHQQTVEASFTEAIKKLSDSSSDVFLRSGMELNRTFEKLANGIDLINHALRDLGQNQIPVEAKKKRGFFSRR